MGGGVVAAYANANPAHALFVCGFVPMLDIADIRDNNRAGLAAAVNAAYGGLYNDEIHGPTHSPVRFAATMDPSVPVMLLTSSNDPLAIPSAAAAFKASRPGTTVVDLGPVGHSTAAYLPGVPAAVDFCVGRIN